ncbi:MAG: FAD/NAD(P)-binding protein [Candidatus Buchananbacteria bacterium]
MHNLYIPKLVRVIKIVEQTPDIKLFTFEFIERKNRINFAFNHGQFLMLGLLNHGEAAFDICSSASQTKTFDLAIRKVGTLTTKLHELNVGDQATVRGPFGNGLPEKMTQGKDLLLVGGGSGFIVMRSIVLDFLAGKLPANKVNVFYGCQDEHNLLFKREFCQWQKKVGLDVVLASPSKKWKGPTGVITVLFNKKQDFANTVALVVGPPVMYRPVIENLKKQGVKDEDIYISLERKMYCGVGVCQHCAIGPYYVCKDGPIFSWAQLKDIPGTV